MDCYQHEFLIVAKYLGVADLLTLSKTCHAMHDLLAPKSEFWMRYVYQFCDFDPDCQRYLLGEGVLYKVFYFAEKNSTKCPFCLNDSGHDLPEATECSSIAIMNLCDADKCPGYAKWLMEYFIPKLNGMYEKAIVDIGLDYQRFKWFVSKNTMHFVTNYMERYNEYIDWYCYMDIESVQHYLGVKRVTTELDVPFCHFGRILNQYVDRKLGHYTEIVCDSGVLLPENASIETARVFKWPWQIGVLEFFYFSKKQEAHSRCPVIHSDIYCNAEAFEESGVIKIMTTSMADPNILVVSATMDELRQIAKPFK